MMVASTSADVEQIQLWTKADSYHNTQNSPEWWLTGNGALSFRLDDTEGPVAYFRIDSGEDFRLNCQFAPTEVVSKRRLVTNMLKLFPIVIDFAKKNGGKGLVYCSISPTLIKFMERLGFVSIGDNDYRYQL